MWPPQSHSRAESCVRRCLLLIRMHRQELSAKEALPMEQRKRIWVSLRWPLNHLSRAQNCLFLEVFSPIPLEVIYDCVSICA